MATGQLSYVCTVNPLACAAFPCAHPKSVVMATGQGLELYQGSPKGQGLRYMGSRKHPTTWCTYSHESRIALLATGEGGLWLQVTPLLFEHTCMHIRMHAHTCK